MVFFLLICIPLSVSAGNVIVRNGQLNVSSGFYSDSDTFYVDSENDMVGIGTTSPQFKVHVEDTGNLARVYVRTTGESDTAELNLKTVGNTDHWAIFNDASGNLGFWQTSTKITVQNNTGYVGIGTASPKWGLDIIGNGTVHFGINPVWDHYTDVMHNTYWNDTVGAWASYGGGPGSLIQPGGGPSSDSYIAFMTSPNSTGVAANSIITLTEKMRIDKDGNVGIGTTNPSEKLHVDGTIRTNITSCSQALETDSDGNIVCGTDESGSGSSLWTNSSGNATYTAGRVGIGTVTPYELLQVDGNVRINHPSTTDYNLSFWQDNVNHVGNIRTVWDGSYWDMRLGTYNFLDTLTLSDNKVGIGTASPSDKLNVNGSLRIDNATGSAVLFVNASSGNIGIGTTAPGERIDIVGGSIKIENSETDAVLKLANVRGQIGYDASEDSLNLQAAGSRVIRFNINDVFGEGEVARIDTNGRVGIGTASPSYKLNVNGSLRVDNSTGSAIFFVNATSGRASIGGTGSEALFTVQGYSGGTVGSAVSNYTKTMIIGGDYNQPYNLGNATLLLISDYGNDEGDNIYPIYVEDENNGVDFYIRNNGSAVGGIRSAYFGGYVGIGATSMEGKLDMYSGVGSDVQIDWNSNGTLNYSDAKADLVLTRRHSPTPDSNLGYAANLIDFRAKNGGGAEWSVAQIVSSVDPQGGSNFQGGLSFLTGGGGTEDPAGRRNAGTAPMVRMTIDQTGRVGIGTMGPVGPLDVNGTLGHFYIDSGGSSAIFTRDGWNYITTSGASSKLALRTGGTDWEDVRVAILSDGKVGIGTTSPSEKLEVNGTIKASGFTGQPFGWAKIDDAGTYTTNEVDFGVDSAETTYTNGTTWDSTLDQFNITQTGVYEVTVHAIVNGGSSVCPADIYIEVDDVDVYSVSLWLDDDHSLSLNWVGLINSGSYVTTSLDGSTYSLNYVTGSTFTIKRIS